MRRKILMVVLALGTVAGFGSGFARMGHRHCGHRRAFEERVAEVCVEAARRADEGAAPRSGAGALRPSR